jgi:glycosyltransferase involved in cell wall biosynthesis
VPVLLSIVVPVYNEQDHVLTLAKEVSDAMEKQTVEFELIFVDDASSDRTWDRVAEARHADPRIYGVRHVNRSGQSAAIWTGFSIARGDTLATMDGDRQNDPADLPRLLECLTKADFICGVRTDRKDDWLRRVSSRVACTARRTVLGVDLQDIGCSLRVFRRSSLAGVPAFNGWHRFLPLLVDETAVRIVEVPVNHRPRLAGRSKYGVWNRLGRGLVDLLAVAWYRKRQLRSIAFTRLT